MFRTIAKFLALQRRQVVATPTLPAVSPAIMQPVELATTCRRRPLISRWKTNHVTGRLECHWQLDCTDMPADEDPQPGWINILTKSPPGAGQWEARHVRRTPVLILH
jgi:hypothetical protein